MDYSRPSSKLVDLVSRFSEQDENPVIKRRNQILVRWDSFRIEKVGENFLITFCWHDEDMLVQFLEGPISFDKGQTLTIDGIEGKLELEIT